MGGFPFGAFMDAAMNIPKIQHAEEMQQDAQEHAFASQLNAQEFSAHQAATVHQRGVADLRAAGLNPILSARLGGNPAASSSGGGGAGGSTAQLASNFTQAQINSAQAKLLKQQEKTEVERTRSEHEQIYKNFADAGLREQEIKTEIQNTEAARHQAEILESNAKGRRLEGKIDETKFGEIMRYIDRAMNAIRGGSSAIQQQRNPVREHRRVR